MALRHAVAIAIAIIGIGASGCSSSPNLTGKIPFPAGAEDCATYCRVWVPPTYRDVADVVQCKKGFYGRDIVCAKKVEFDEVCTPGRYEIKRTPASCRTEEAVVPCCQGTDRWVRTECGCDGAECFRHERAAATFRLCDKTVTDNGVEYCAYQEPRYDVVPRTRIVKECAEVYRPAEYGVRWHKEIFQEGHWEWHKRDCPVPCVPPPARKRCCAPSCAPSCAPRCAPRGGFECAPSRD